MDWDKKLINSKLSYLADYIFKKIQALSAAGNE